MTLANLREKEEGRRRETRRRREGRQEGEEKYLM